MVKKTWVTSLIRSTAQGGIGLVFLATFSIHIALGGEL